MILSPVLLIMGNTLQKIPEDKFQRSNELDIHHCSESDYCFYQYIESDAAPEKSCHVHFKDTRVTIVRKQSDVWVDYTISRLEFILMFPNLMKKMVNYLE